MAFVLFFEKLMSLNYVMTAENRKVFIEIIIDTRTIDIMIVTIIDSWDNMMCYRIIVVIPWEDRLLLL